MFYFHPLASFSCLYLDSHSACDSKPNALQYLRFPQLQLSIEKEGKIRALTFSSRSFADFKNLFSHNEKKPDGLTDNVFSLSPHLFVVIPMT